MGKIIMNGNVYGSMGSDVEANPQGTATDTLNTIGIDNVIYSIEGSGGSGGSIYKETILWSNPNGETAYPSSPVQVTLSQSINDFDLIFIESAIENDPVYRNNNITPVSSIDKTGNIYFNNVNIGGHDYHVPTVSCEDDTHFTLRGYASANPMVFYKITGIRFGNSNISPIIYSTEEREIGVWIDNKPLYQKTFNKMDVVLSDNNWTNNILGTTGIAIKQYEGYFALDGYTSLFSYEYYRGSSEYFTANINSSGDINVRPNMNAGADVLAGIITIWYTKDSDVPGSGQYNTLAVPTIHYSTDEQVIGIDYDSKPIYQKTYTNLGTINSSTNIDLQLSNISWITVDSANSNLSNCIPFPYIHPNTANMVGYFFDMNNGSPIINCRAGSDASGTFTLDKLTVRYKKTTD